MFEKVKEFMAARKLALIGLASTGLVYAASAEINLSAISDLITAIVDLVPDLIDLVIGVAPVIIVVALIGFIVKFFDKIVEMMNIR